MARTPLEPDPHGAAVDREAVAVSLIDAWQRGTFVDAPSRGAARFSKADALAIAERVRELRIAAGATPVGYKVGFTNPAVREQFSAEAQLAAPVYDQTLAREPSVDPRPLLGPRIEPEVVVGLGADGEIAWAALGFEIVQSHVRDWKFGYLDAIADFGLHARLIIGERRPLSAAGGAALDAMPVQLFRNGEVVERGAGSDVEGGAAGSVRWLRAHLRRVGRDLLPGEIVSTGSMTRVLPIASGERWTIEAFGAEFAPLSIDVE
jgi:2-oxo-3-hexenedioate decarboxylase